MQVDRKPRNNQVDLKPRNNQGLVGAAVLLTGLLLPNGEGRGGEPTVPQPAAAVAQRENAPWKVEYKPGVEAVLPEAVFKDRLALAQGRVESILGKLDPVAWTVWPEGKLTQEVGTVDYQIKTVPLSCRISHEFGHRGTTVDISVGEVTDEALTYLFLQARKYQHDNEHGQSFGLGNRVPRALAIYLCDPDGSQAIALVEKFLAGETSLDKQAGEGDEEFSLRVKNLKEKLDRSSDWLVAAFLHEVKCFELSRIATMDPEEVSRALPESREGCLKAVLDNREDKTSAENWSGPLRAYL